MKVRVLISCAVLACAAVAVGGVAVAKDKAKTYVVVNEDVGVPVFAYDITDRPYTVIGEVKAGVRKATVFSKEASQEKIYKELWERAEKMGADAVVNASYGDARVTLTSWGASKATGVAVRFVSPERSAEP